MKVKAKVLAALVLLTMVGGAQAQTVEQFYTGKTINFIVPFSAGGYYDSGARLFARYMGQYIPG